MTTVKHLINSKADGTQYAVQADDTVLKALRLMAEARIGAVLVIDAGKIVGIFTERDYALKGELEGRTAKDTLVREVMTEEMYTVTTDTSADHCMALMMEHGIRHLPVVENGKLLGIISMRDVIADELADRESEIKGLENYILATGFER
jgi:CBS domain-containing protein